MIRKLNQEDISRANELFAIAFEHPMERRPLEPEGDKFQRWAAFDDRTGEMMSTLTVTGIPSPPGTTANSAMSAACRSTTRRSTWDS